MFSDRAFRILLTATVYLIFLEGLSWLTSTGLGPCIVSPEQHDHASENNHQQPCATFLQGSLILLGRADHFVESHDKSIVAVFTIVLAISTILLWRATSKLHRATLGLAKGADEQIELSKKAVDTAEKQMLIAGLQTDIQKKQHAIGRLQFLVTHRPRLRVRHVLIVDPGEHIGLNGLFFDHGKEIKGGLVVVNVGGSKATIVKSDYRIYFSKTGLPVGIAPYEKSAHALLIVGQYLQVGESCATPILDTIIMEPPSPGIDAELRVFERDGWKIYVMGQIQYQDEGGADRFMGFCRERGSDGRFCSVDDPDYEYED